MRILMHVLGKYKFNRCLPGSLQPPEVGKNWRAFMNGMESIMFKFTKKDSVIEEQVLEDVNDEQLDQVTGGSLLQAVNVGGVLDTASAITGPVLQTVGSIGVSGISVQAAGASVTTPAITPGTLLF
jgi:hypothetical protein